MPPEVRASAAINRSSALLKQGFHSVENHLKIKENGLFGAFRAIFFFACGAPKKEGFTAQPFDFRPLAEARMVRLPVAVTVPTFCTVPW